MILHLPLRNQIVSLTTALAVLFTGNSAACWADAVIPPYADELPATTAICIWSDDARQLADQWQKTALFQVYAAEPMRPFWSDLRKKREGLLPHEQLGLSWQDLVEVSAGTWVLAHDFGSDGQGTLLMVDVRGREAAADKVLGTVGQNWKDRGMSVRQQPYPWGKVFVAARPDAQRWAFIHDSRLYLTDRLALAKSLFARRREDGPVVVECRDLPHLVGEDAGRSAGLVAVLRRPVAPGTVRGWTDFCYRPPAVGVLRAARFSGPPGDHRPSQLYGRCAGPGVYRPGVDQVPAGGRRGPALVRQFAGLPAGATRAGRRGGRDVPALGYQECLQGVRVRLR